MMRTFLCAISISFLSLIIFSLPQDAFAAVRTWDGGGVTNNWSENANWSGNLKPGVADSAVFNATSVKDATIDEPFTIISLTIAAAYGGTITHGAAADLLLTATGASYSQAGGAYIGSSSALDLAGSFSVSGTSSFTAPTGNWFIADDLSITFGVVFDANGGTLIFDGSPAAVLTLPSPPPLFANLTVDKAVTVSVTSVERITTSGTMTLEDGRLGLNTIAQPDGIFIVNTDFDLSIAGAAVIIESGTADVFLNGGEMPGLTVNANRNVYGPNDDTGQVRINGTLAMNDGSFVGSGGGVQITGDLLLNDGTVSFLAPTLMRLEGENFIVADGVVFDANEGMIFVQNSGNDVYMEGDITFADFAFESAVDSETALIFANTAGDSYTFEGAAQFTQGTDAIEDRTSGIQGSGAPFFFNGPAVMGDVTVNDLNNAGTSTIFAFDSLKGIGTLNGIEFFERLVIEKEDVATDESGDTAIFSFVLSHEPSASVTVPLSISDLTEGTLSNSSLLFTDLNWDIPQLVTVTGADDALDDGPQSFSLTIGSLTSADTAYHGQDTDDITVENADDDAGDAVIDTERAHPWEQEDVKETADLPIDWMEFVEYDNGYVVAYATGNLMADSGGSNVDLTSSRIKPGCVVDVDGDLLTILKIRDAGTGEVVLGAPGEVPSGHAFASGTVNAITCAMNNTDYAGLNTAFVTVDSSPDVMFSSDPAELSYRPGTLDYDADNDVMWMMPLGGGGVEVERISIPDLLSLGGIATSGGSSVEGLVVNATNDAVWVIDTPGSLLKLSASGGGYANGTLGASLYDVSLATNIAVRTLTGDLLSPTLEGVNGLEILSGATASLLNSIPLHFSNYPVVTYNWVSDDAWISRLSDVYIHLSAIDLDTGEGLFSATGSVSIPRKAEYSAVNAYEAEYDVFWVANNNCVDGDIRHATIIRVDASTGDVLSRVPSLGCSGGIAFNEDTDSAYVTDVISDAIQEFDTATGELRATYPTDYCTSSVKLVEEYDSDLFAVQCNDGTLDRLVPRAVPAGDFYSMVTTNGTRLDTTDWVSIASTDVVEDVDGAAISYAFSFNGRDSFKVFAAGAWRTVASRLATDHGGADGTWHYRDVADTWEAAPGDSAPRAISEAADEGVINRMSSAAVEALTNSDWVATGGFVTEGTGALDASLTFRATDWHQNPTVDRLSFTEYVPVSGGSQSVFSTNEAVIVNADVPCTVTADVRVRLEATDARDYMLSNFADFQDAQWQSFTPQNSEPPTRDSSGKLVHHMTVSWSVVPGDGVREVYARFRSSDQNVSPSVMDRIVVDAAGECGAPDDGIPSGPGGTSGGENGEEAPPIITGQPYEQLVRTTGQPGVYAIFADGTRHPFMNLPIFLTYEDSFRNVRVISDKKMGAYVMGAPMPPKPGTLLVKTPSSNEVYVLIENPVNPSLPYRRLLPDEETAVRLFGTTWSMHVFDLDPTLLVRLPLAFPMMGDEVIDPSLLRNPDDLYTAARAISLMRPWWLGQITSALANW